MTKKVKNISINASVSFCEDSKLYTIFSNNQGGPIITNEDLISCKHDFENSMALSIGLSNLTNMVLGKEWLKISSIEYSEINYVN